MRRSRGILLALLVVLLAAEAAVHARGDGDPGEVIVLDGTTGRGQPLRTFSVGEPGDEFGYNFVTNFLPVIQAPGIWIGAPGASAPGRSSGSVVAFDPATGAVAATIRPADLSPAPLARLGHALIDLCHPVGYRDGLYGFGAPATKDSDIQPAFVIAEPERDGSMKVKNRIVGDAGSLMGWTAARVVGDGFFFDYVVTAPGTRRGRKDNVGAVQFHRLTTGEQVWRHVGNRAGGHLGFAVVVVADRDGDGHLDFAVSEPGTRDGKTPGRVYVFSSQTGTLQQTIEAPKGSKLFGFAIAQTRDLNGDGRRDLLVTAPATDVGDKTEAGAVFIVSGTDGSVVRRINGRIANQWFGVSLGEFTAARSSAMPYPAKPIGSLLINLKRVNRDRRGLVETYDLDTGNRRQVFRGRQGGEHFGVALFDGWLFRRVPGEDNPIRDLVISRTNAPLSYIPE